MRRSARTSRGLDGIRPRGQAEDKLGRALWQRRQIRVDSGIWTPAYTDSLDLQRLHTAVAKHL